MTSPRDTLEAEGIRKSYGGIIALKGVDFRARASSVHALLGENGAGKSTLVKVLVGAIFPDAGTLHLDGREVRFSSTADAAAHGVAIVSQELSLFPDLDVLSNLFPMREPLRGPFVVRARMAEQAEPVLRELGLDVDPRTTVASLSLEQRQLLEIARALMVRPRVLILDEPTSALHVRETERLHEVLRTLRQRGVAGLSESGHRDVLEVAAGLFRPSKGYVRLPSGELVQHDLRAAIRQGVALVPGDRRRIGVMLDKPVWDNIAQVRAVALGRDGSLLQAGQLRARARAHVMRLGIKTSSVDQEVGGLSGGNQQKVVFAKWLEAGAWVLLLDDPTRGIDVGAKAEIYGLMRELAQRGIVQVLASTDPFELATVCDRVFVFYNR